MRRLPAGRLPAGRQGVRKSANTKIRKMKKPISLVSCSKSLFIKLGRKGEWEKDCIKNGYLKLGYREASYDDCVKGKWNAVCRSFRKRSKSAQTATSFTNQVKHFFESDGQVLWITFYDNKLWWGFVEKKIRLLKDGTKVRNIIGGWSDRDVQGNELRDDKLSGSLSKTQAYRGTICEVPEAKYLLRKINAQESVEVKETKEALNTLEHKVMTLIQGLHWKDFEILIDLIFRYEGWQRIRDVGKTAKTLDLDLLLPITGEKAIVQIKSCSDRKECMEYLSKFHEKKGYQKFFYVVHTHNDSLKDLTSELKKGVYLWLGDDVAKLTVKAGLVDWVLGKVQ